MTRKWLQLIVILLMVGGLIGVDIGSAPPARADALGCTPSDPSYSVNCIVVRGQGKYVDWIQGRRNYWTSPYPPVPGAICNYQFALRVKKPSASWETFWGPKRSGCAHTGDVYQEWTVHKNYPDGTLLCIRVYIDNGRLTSGQPCAEVIHKPPPPPPQPGPMPCVPSPSNTCNYEDILG